MSTQNIVLSCLQPTGDLHVGNYLGAIKNMVELQEQYLCSYGVVDYHSMTMPYKSDKLRENTWKLCFQLLACGIESDNIFIQSLIPEHQELCWILSCVTSYGELQRMTQFKDKSQQVAEQDAKQFISAGLLYYPVLQAADILIYRADYVPIGKDQEQHLELSRNIAARFNHQYGTEYFRHPEALYTETPKILSTADPTRKMSKSLGEKHYLGLMDDEARIIKKIKSAVTDTGADPSGDMSPGIKNLFLLLQNLGSASAYESLLTDYKQGTLKYSELKQTVAEATVSYLRPIQARYHEISSDKRRYKDMIKSSSAEIRKRAQQTVREVRDIAGLQSLKL